MSIELNDKVEMLELDLDSKNLDSQASDTEDDFDIIEESILAVEELIEVGNVIQGTVADGKSLTDDAVQMAEIAVESIFNKLSYTLPVKSVVSLEDYAALTGPEEKTEASKTTMQRIAEVVKKIFEGIKNFFKNMLDKLMDFLKYLTDSNVRNKSTVNKLKEKIKVFKRDKVEPSNKILDFSKYGVAFNCINVKDIFTNLAKTLTSHIAATKIQDDVNKDLGESVRKIDNVAKIEDIEKLVSLNASFEITEPLINGTMLVVRNRELVVENKKIRPMLLGSAALELDDLDRICTANDKLIDMNIEVSKNYSGLARDIKKAVSVLDKLTKVDDKRDWEVETYKRVADVLKANVAVVRVYNFFIPKVNDLIIRKTNGFIGQNLTVYAV